MDYLGIKKLGDLIEQDYREAAYDDRQFPDIAARRLTDFIPEGDFDLQDALDILFTTDVEQHPRQGSDLPITVYKQDNFYIEILVWNHSTTAIHQHAFAGAFRLLEGKSLQSEYSFSENNQHTGDDNLLMGKVSMRQCRLLSKGETCRIYPGIDGFIHSIFHLVEPSITLVVRTYGLPWAMPQYTLLTPNMAIAQAELENLNQVILASRAYNLIVSLGDEPMMHHWLKRVAKMRFSEVVAITLSLGNAFTDTKRIHSLLEIVERESKDNSEALKRMLDVRIVKRSLILSRRVVTNVDLRFFIALLINMDNREVLFDIVKQYYPDEVPEKLCVHWMDMLGDPSEMLEKAHALGKKGDPVQQSTMFILNMLRGRRLVPEDTRLLVLEILVTGGTGAMLKDRLQEQYAAGLHEKSMEAFDHFYAMPELSVFTGGNEWKT